MELKEIQSQLERSDAELAALYAQRSKIAAGFAQLRTQSANKTAKPYESESAEMKSKRLAKRAKVVGGSGSGMSVPLTSTY